MLSDFNFVKLVIKEFLEQKHILQRLEFIKRERINDWEKWLQIELFHFMKNHHEIGKVEREKLYKCDRRKNYVKKSMYVDLIFRKKRARLDSYIQVELKCDVSFSKLFYGIESDIKKVMSMRLSNDDGRSFWCIGFYTKVAEEENNFIVNKISDYGYNFHGFTKNNAVGYIIV
ncbi:hypothetical protein [Pragia fontium]|uniref:hypothetical protein n=1 Tax=Pragia fontium TaxID=82985 RepID=UPI000F6E5526|nr:hypothetical protein [Pragia fontium]VEJ53809.1 Uncharacterised protein [Pragia fontium]